MNFAEIEKSILGISTRTVTMGVVSGLGAYYLVPGAQGSVGLMGYEVPSWAVYIAAFGLVGASNEAVKDFMKKYTPSTAKLYEYSPFTSAVTAVGVMYGVNLLLGGDWIPSMQQILYPAAIGFVGDYTSSMITDGLINPIMDVKKIGQVGKSLLPEAHILEELPLNLNHITDGLIMF